MDATPTAFAFIVPRQSRPRLLLQHVRCLRPTRTAVAVRRLRLRHLPRLLAVGEAGRRGQHCHRCDGTLTAAERRRCGGDSKTFSVLLDLLFYQISQGDYPPRLHLSRPTSPTSSLRAPLPPLLFHTPYCTVAASQLAAQCNGHGTAGHPICSKV